MGKVQKIAGCSSVVGLMVVLLSSLVGFCSADCNSLRGSGAQYDVFENETVGHVIANVAVNKLTINHTDPDASKNWFNVRKVTTGSWEIFVQNKLDSEMFSPQQYPSVSISFRCQSTPSTTENTYSITIVIIDVNEYAPYFDKPDFEITIPESVENGTSVYTMKAYDMDQSSETVIFQYKIVDGGDGYFEIPKPFTGNISLVKPLDYEARPEPFVLNISATEYMYPSEGKTNYTTLTISVEDVDDLQPKFSSSSYSLSVPEGNYTQDRWFDTSPPLFAWDQDLTINQTIQYKLDPATRSPYDRIFSVAPNGSIEIEGNLFIGKFSIVVMAYQVDNPQFRFAITTVDITVTDVNDFEPQMSQTEYPVNISEATAPGTVILIVSASDEDVGNNSEFIFELETAVNGIFTVETDHQMGIIRLVTSLDRENETDYEFKVWAKETMSKEKYRSQSSVVKIHIVDENDNNPEFDESEYTFNTTTAHIQGNVVGTVSATDRDYGDNGFVTYGIKSPISEFAINNDTGDITSTKNFTYQETGSYSFIVSATDRADDINKRRTSFAEVTIIILPDHVSSPVFENKSYTFTVKETATVGYFIGKVTANDVDGGVMYYTMSENETDIKLDPKSGEITLTREVDLDSNPTPDDHINFQISATNGQHTNWSDVTVIFLPVNEFTPHFKQLPSVTIFENATVDTFIAKVTATDNDAGPDGQLTYSLIETSTSILFKINSSTGEIRLNCSACLENRSYYIPVQVTDGGTPHFLDTMSFRVDVIKTVFASPHFSQKVYLVILPENQPAQIVLQLSATDLDSTNLIFSSTNQSSFECQLTVFEDGSVYLNGSCDAEKQIYFVIGVSVTDGLSFDYASIEVNITDVNDNPPILNFTSSVPVELPEQSKFGKVVATVVATDKDITNHGFSYFLSNGADGKFHIDDKGVITLVGLLDRRQKDVYNITVNALDHGVPPSLGYEFLEVDVTDSNTAPIFVDSSNNPVLSYDFNVSEALKIGELIGSLYAYDPDSGTSGQLSFSFEPQDLSNLFSLDPSSGNLTLANTIDYESRQKYPLTVFVTDYSLQPLSASATVNIFVIDVEEAPVWPLPLPTVYITESSICTKQQQHLQAFSEEVTTVSSHGDTFVEYFLLNFENVFSINETSGLLKINGTLHKGTYQLEINACNNGTTVCANATLPIEVKEDNILAFCPTFYSVDLNESTNVTNCFLDLNTTKSDSTVNYSISSGNIGSTFSITTDGKLCVEDELDRETDSSYILYISAEDTVSHEVAEAQVIIKLLDAPDEKPQFSATNYQGEVSESQPKGSHVFIEHTNIPLIVKATDKDLNPQLTYSIDKTSDTSNGSFEITEGAEILLSQKIDYETIPVSFNKSYTFEVLVTDQFFTSSTTITVHIQDFNDNPPEFDVPGNLVLNVTEGNSLIQDLANISASDPDTQSRLVYSLSSISPPGTDKYFYIDRSSGLFGVIRELDHEATDEYILNVTVTDGEHTIFKKVTVNVLDVNDNSPMFNQTFHMTVTEEKFGIGTNISITAYDPDFNLKDADLTYSIVKGDDSHNFQFDKKVKNVLRTVKPIDREALVHDGIDKIHLIIEAVDNGQPPRTGTGSVIVTIQDINDNPPQFSQSNYYAFVSKDDTNVTVTLTPPFNVTDPDSDDYSGFKFSLSDYSTPFTIDNDTGTLFIIHKPDEDVYDFTITVVDDNGYGLNSSAKIFIKVTDANDAVPHFLQAVYNFKVYKNSALRQLVGNITATEKINGPVMYKLNDSRMFYIDPFMGSIYLFGDSGSKNTDSYVLNASACDSKLQCDFVRVYIEVIDTTDRCPLWNMTSLNLSVEEKHSPISLGYISVLDSDESIPNDVKYFLNDTDGNNYIEISTSGEVRLLTQLTADKSDITSFSFSVYAEDISLPSCILHEKLNITVLGINDNDPVICYQEKCGMPTIEVSVFDGSHENTLVALIAVHDNDTGLDGEVTLTLKSKPADLFTLTDSKVILLKEEINMTNLKTIDKIKNDTIDLILLAKDKGQEPQSTNVTIKVKVVGAKPSDIPDFTSTIYNMVVSENNSSGAYVGTVTTTAAAGVSFNYFISPSDGNVPFTIDSQSGDITTTAALDREAVSLYYLTVEATISKWHIQALVNITVEDVNEPPTFDSQIITETASENTAPIVLVTIVTHDGDEGDNGTVKYYLVNASLYANFAIDETSGVLSVITPLDRETTPSYDLIIEAVDGGSPPLSATVHVHVDVVDVNDNVPKFTNYNNESTIIVSQPPVKVQTVKAVDADEGINKKILYFLENDSDTFTIDPLTGDITTIAFPSFNSYTLVVVATDEGTPPLNSTVSITVIVLDNRTRIEPSLSLSTNILSLFVGMTEGTQLHVSITAKDASYLYISGVNGTGIFKLENGTIFLNQTLTRKSVYVLNITAASSTQHSVSQELVIQVDDIKFVQKNYASTVTETINTPQIVIDIDSYPEQNRIPVIYSLSDNYDSAFNINRSTGELWVLKSLDRELTSVYVLNVSVSLDHSLGSRRKRALAEDSATVSVYIWVKDENDNRPSFVNPEMHLSVPGNVNTSYIITTLKAFDLDEGFNGLIRYSITSGDNDVFDLNPETGDLTVASPEKLRLSSSFELTVKATDKNGTGDSSFLNITISVVTDGYLFRLPTPLPVSILKEHLKEIVSKLSHILGFTVSDPEVTEHEEYGIVDPSRSDILFRAIQANTDTTTYIFDSKIGEKVFQHEAEIENLFKSYLGQPNAEKQEDLNKVSISLIAVAGALLIATLLAVIITCRMWKKQKKNAKKAKTLDVRYRIEEHLKMENGKKLDVRLEAQEHIEMTAVSQASISRLSAILDTQTETAGNDLQHVQKSLQELASESVDSSIPSPHTSNSEGNQQESLESVQRSATVEGRNESASLENGAEEKGEEGNNILDVEDKTEPAADYTKESENDESREIHNQNGEDENEIEQQEPAHTPITTDSDFTQEYVNSSSSSSASNGDVLHDRNPDPPEDENTSNNSSELKAVSFQAEPSHISPNEDDLSDTEEDMTHF